MVPALLIPRQKAPKTHNYKVSLDNGLTLEFASDKLLNDKEVQDVVDGMNADGTIEKMALAANKKKAATKAANEKQAAKMDKANRDLELLKSQTKNAQRKAREASMGYNIGESIIGAAKAVEANPAVKEFNRIIKMVDSNLPSGRIVEAGINALPPEAKKVVKGIRDPFTLTSLVTGTAETIGGLMSRPEKTSYEQYGVAFDPKADPVQRLAAAVNIIGTAFSVGGATRTIAKKLPSQAELKALQDALTATKGRKATRGEAFNEFQKLRKLSEEQAKATAKATAAAAVASAKAAKAGTTTTPPTAGATTATTPPAGAATTGTPKAKPKSRTATATTAPTASTATPRPPVTTSLPKPLAGAKPRYNSGRNSYAPEFESDFDKAAYITSQKTPSRRDAEYLDWAMKESGMTADEVRAHGQKVRAEIKKAIANVKGGTSEKPAVIKIARVAPDGASPSPTATTATPSATGPAAATPNPQPATAPTGAPTGTPSATTATRTMADVDKELKDLEVKLQEALAKNDFDEADNLVGQKKVLLQEGRSLIGNKQPGTTTTKTTTGAATATTTPKTAPSTAKPQTVIDIEKEISDVDAKMRAARARGDYDEADDLLNQRTVLYQSLADAEKAAGPSVATPPTTTTPAAPTATPNPQPTASPTATPSGATTSTTAATTTATGTTPKAKPKAKPAGTTNTSAQSGGGTAAATQAATSQAAEATAAATVPTGKAKPKSRPPRDDQPGGANNATADAMRQGEGLGPVESNVKNFREDGTTSDNYDFNDYQSRLKDISENGSKSKPLDQEEVSNWKSHRSELKRRIAAVGKKIKEGDTSPETLKKLQNLQKQRDEADVALKSTGTMSSLSLGERRNIIRDSYLREDLEYKAIAANDGPLTKEQQLKLDELIQKEENFALKSDGMDALDELTRKEAEKFIANLGDTAKKAGTKADRDAAWAELRQAVLRLGSKASAGIDPDDLVVIAKSIRKVARTYYDFGMDLDGLVKIVLQRTRNKFPELKAIDEEDIIRALASKEGDKPYAPPKTGNAGVNARNLQDVKEMANRAEIDNFIREIKLAAEQRSLHPAVKVYAEVGNFFRGVKAGFDASPVGNQGLYMWAMNPRASARALTAFVRAAKSEEEFYQIMGNLRTHEHYDLAVASKLRANSINMAVDEVPFSSKLLDRVPFSKAANRAYNAYQNVLRVEAFDDMLNAISDGKPTLSDAGVVAEFVNTATGAGTGKLADLAAKFNAMTMNTALFSSGYRVAKGKFSMMTPLANALIYGKKTGNYKPATAIAKKYGQLLTAYGALYSAIIASGGKVDFDPESPNQFKVRLLNSDVWVDPTGGLYGFLQALYQTFNGSKKLAKDKANLSIKEDGTYAKNPAGYNRLLRYVEGGMGPLPRAAMGLYTGKSFGKDLSPKTAKGRLNIATTLLLPIWGEQSAEMVQDKKLPDAMKVAAILFSFGGIPSDARGVEIPRQ